jgi:hypothetical protein
MSALRIITNGYAFGTLISAGTLLVSGGIGAGAAIGCFISAFLLALCGLLWLLDELRGVK